MPFINLIEEQRLAIRQGRAKARTGMLVFIATTTVSVLGCGWLFLESENMTSEIARLQNEARKSEPVIKQIEAAQAEVAALGPKLNTLENAIETTGKWETVLSHLTTQTPKGLWLTNVRCVSSDPSKPIEVNFQGISARLDTIGEFILRMQGCKELENVNLKYTQEKMLASGQGIEFEVNSSLAGTAEEVAKNEESTEEKK
jgi:Tfp pilus assembly protein PilN